MLKLISGLIQWFRFWQAHREAAPMIAQELYEPLSPEDEQRLDELCRLFPKLNQERHSLKKVRKALVLSEDNWQGDLLPAIHEKLAVSRGGYRHTRRANAYVFAFSLVILFSLALYGLFMLSDQNDTFAPVAGQISPRADTPLSRLGQDACDMVALGEAERASELLAQAIQEYPADPYHADALLTLADIEYTYLQRYERAYEVLKLLERDHRDIFNRNWDHDKRVRLLSAALPDAFTPIRELESAARSENPLQGYEQVLAEYPDKIWADEALHSMTRLIARHANAYPTDTIQVLQQLRSVCTHPVALARIDLELGNYYCDSLDDLERARTHYAEAAASRNFALSAKAQEALARLD